MRTKEVLLWRLHKEVIFHDILEKRVLYPIYKSVMHKTDPKNTATARLKKEHSKARRELRRLKSFKNPKDPLLANAVNAAVHRLKIHFYEVRLIELH
jgi:iron-sulfur cluster repair protein YtfE (RIC family)